MKNFGMFQWNKAYSAERQLASAVPQKILRVGFFGKAGVDNGHAVRAMDVD